MWDCEPFSHYSIGLLAQLGLKYPPPGDSMTAGRILTCKSIDTMERSSRVNHIQVSETVSAIRRHHKEVNELLMPLAATQSIINRRESVSSAELINNETLMLSVTMYEDCRNDWFSYINMAKNIDKLYSPFCASSNNIHGLLMDPGGTKSSLTRFLSGFAEKRQPDILEHE